MKALAYLRASTEEQERSGLGLEAQVATVRAACEQRSWQLVGLEKDIASGSRKNSPVSVWYSSIASQVPYRMAITDSRRSRGVWRWRLNKSYYQRRERTRARRTDACFCRPLKGLVLECVVSPESKRAYARGLTNS